MKPMGVLLSITYFIIPATILYGTHYLLVPSFLTHTGYPYLTSWVNV